MLDLPGLGSSRAYSVSNTANPQGEWHFQIRRVANGRGTQVLFDVLQPGDTVGLDGPYGAAWLRTDSPEQLDQLLDQIGSVDGVEKTTTSIILSNKLDRGQPI